MANKELYQSAMKTLVAKRKLFHAAVANNEDDSVEIDFARRQLAEAEAEAIRAYNICNNISETA